jgi:hypothetical protein
MDSTTSGSRLDARRHNPHKPNDSPQKSTTSSISALSIQVDLSSIPLLLRGNMLGNRQRACGVFATLDIAAAAIKSGGS